MKKHLKALLFLVCLTLTGHLWAQNSGEMKTLFSGSGIKSVGGYGAFSVGVAQAKSNQISIGGFGGAVFNQKWVIGLGGNAYIPTTSFLGTDKQGNSNVDLKASVGYGFLYFEYIPKLTSPLHLSFPLVLGLGGASVQRDDDLDKLDLNTNIDNTVESSLVGLIKVGLNLEFNVAKFFIPALNVSYNFVKLNNNLVNLKNEDLSGVTVELAFKFGFFGVKAKTEKK